tara:strand:+ start:1790 stop:3298 length:1509 start_codon:yes stop_codon:yes gene_type:complete
MKKIFFTVLVLCCFGFTSNAQNCTASFNFSNSPVNSFLYQFTNTSSTGISNFDSIKYFWSFGDGNFSNQMNPSHVYNSPGSYLVCLQMDVTNSQGASLCFDSICATINISFPTSCVSDFTWSASASNPNAVLFLDSSFVQNASPGNSIVRTWDFGDGSSSSSSPMGSFTHIYNGPGTFMVCLTISLVGPGGSQICSDTYCDTVIINSIPVTCQADFSWDIDSSASRAITFNDSSNFNPRSSNYTDSIVWDFGDGSFGFGDTLSHTYSFSGNYTVCQFLYVLDQGILVCSDSICKQVRVSGPTDFCQIEFIIDSVNSYAGVVYVWNLGDSLNKNSNNSYFWDFGDGNSSSQAYPSHQYSSHGNYELCLSIRSINSFGDTCIQTYCDSLIVRANGSLGKYNTGFVLNILNPLSIGIEEFAKESLEIFPNPANDFVKVLCKGHQNEDLSWEVFDIRGNLVLKGGIDKETIGGEIIDVSSLKNGIYLISINSNSSVFNSKLKISRW